MDSKLTTLAKQRSALDYEMLSKESVRWFQQQIRTIRNPTAISAGIARENGRKQARIVMGNLYYFLYDPKHAKTLPYYDVFPLVLVLKKMNDGFLGLNFHYLPPLYIAAFLDQLLPFAKLNDEEGIERLRVTYNLLQSSRRYKAFAPCLKHYLYDQMGTKPLKVAPDEWETALFLPVERFKKARKETVFKESIEEIKE